VRRQRKKETEWQQGITAKHENLQWSRPKKMANFGISILIEVRKHFMVLR
jgi:hypothetical protein